LHYEDACCATRSAEAVKQIRVAGTMQQEIEQAIDGGRFSLSVDETGTFIKQSFTPDSP
jgi:hypothetical protein